jgi:hypothetical protein
MISMEQSGGGGRNTSEKAGPPQIPDDLTRAQIRAAAVGSRPLTA